MSSVSIALFCLIASNLVLAVVVAINLRAWLKDRAQLHAIRQDRVSLRDYFAARAMQSQVITDMVPGEPCDALLEAAQLHGEDPVYRLACNSYKIADAMLAARDGREWRPC